MAQNASTGQRDCVRYRSHSVGKQTFLDNLGYLFLVDDELLSPGSSKMSFELMQLQQNQILCGKMSHSSLNSKVVTLVLMKTHLLASGELVKVGNAGELIWCVQERNYV